MTAPLTAKAGERNKALLRDAKRNSRLSMVYAAIGAASFLAAAFV